MQRIIPDQFAEHLIKEDNGIDNMPFRALLTGPPGTGKSHVVGAILHKLLEHEKIHDSSIGEGGNVFEVCAWTGIAARNVRMAS